MKTLIVIGGIMLAAAGGVGLFSAMTPGFDYEGATLAERQAWLDGESENATAEIRRGIEKGGVGRHLMDVQAVNASAEEKLIEVIIEAKGASRTIIPKNFRLQFLGEMCPEFTRSPLSKHGFRMNMKIVRSNGDLALSETVSEVACERYYAFKKRTR